QTYGMAPLRNPFKVVDLEKTPLILVGEDLEDSQPVAEPEYTKEGHRPMQLWKVQVQVEHVLQGALPSRRIDIFYFVDLGFVGGSVSRLMHMPKGHSYIFLLQPDGNHWRTIYDGWANCVFWVRTGTHYEYNIDRTRPIANIMVDLLLSRGDRTSDAQMLDAIYHPQTRLGDLPIMDSLERLSREDTSPAVRELASSELAKMSYKRNWASKGQKQVNNVVH
ncbi:MAG: hypothetical protein ACJ74Y_08815, partial [Bryobacteraceae bacterium]